MGTQCDEDDNSIGEGIYSQLIGGGDDTKLSNGAALESAVDLRSIVNSNLCTPSVDLLFFGIIELSNCNPHAYHLFSTLAACTMRPSGLLVYVLFAVMGLDLKLLIKSPLANSSIKCNFSFFLLLPLPAIIAKPRVRPETTALRHEPRG